MRHSRERGRQVEHKHVDGRHARHYDERERSSERSERKQAPRHHSSEGRPRGSGREGRNVHPRREEVSDHHGSERRPRTHSGRSRGESSERESSSRSDSAAFLDSSDSDSDSELEPYFEDDEKFSAGEPGMLMPDLPGMFPLNPSGPSFYSIHGDNGMVLDLVRFVNNLGDPSRGFGGAPAGLSQRQINCFPTNFLPEKHEPTACCVCLEDMVSGQEIRRLPCLHYFHIPCIDTWLAKSRSCPIDKTAF